MRTEFSVIPGKSIGPILLGMGRTDIRKLLGEPSYVEDAYERWGIQFSDKDCWFDSCIQIRYDKEQTVEDIQASAHPDFVVLFESVPVNESSIKEISEVIEKTFPRDENEREFPYIYSYPQIGLSLWREHLEKDKFDTINLTKPKPQD